jgi:hypothetical protein
MKLSINLPQFDGFYNSVFDDIFEISEDLESYGDVTQSEYDNINWDAVHNSIGKSYIDAFETDYKTELLFFGIKSITFEKIDSPKFYNFSTDKLVCLVDFNVKIFKSAVLDFISKNQKEFKIYATEKYKSYSGFISFYSEFSEVWTKEYIKKVTTDNCIFEGFLEFIMVHSMEYDKESINSQILEKTHEFLTFKS